MRAVEVLEAAAATLRDRAVIRDVHMERAMSKTVDVFNGITGNSISELDGWIFMCALKLVRGSTGKPQLDDFIDLAGYAALAGESVKEFDTT